jgi:hypothetical protein
VLEEKRSAASFSGEYLMMEKIGGDVSADMECKIRSFE